MEFTGNLSFHEATLVGVKNTGQTIGILLEGVHLGPEVRNASVWCTGVRQIIRDGVPVDSFNMESDDGEIIALERTRESLRLIVEWNDFEHHRRRTRSYVIVCDSASVEMT